MSTVLCIAILISAFGLAYTLNFTATTLSFGRELSSTGSPRGYQDAITPPWETNFAIVTYSGVLAVIAASWYEFGVASGGLTMLAIFVVMMIATRLVPKKDSRHYRQLIMQSMVSRYADFVRDGDTCRAEVMQDLLAKAGIPANLLRKGEHAETPGMTDAESVEIISAYGKALLSNASAYRDLSALPYPKAQIKEALIIGIKKTTDPQLREQLKGAYITLSGWQAGGAGAELTAEELKDPKKAAARVVNPNSLEVLEKAATEANALLTELTALGLS